MGPGVRLRPEKLDPEWAAHADYLDRMLGLVEAEWKRGLAEKPVAAHGTVAVRFVIDHEGRLARIVGVESSAGEEAAAACVRALEQRAPFGSWWGAMERSLGKETEMTLAFTYR